MSAEPAAALGPFTLTLNPAIRVKGIDIEVGGEREVGRGGGGGGEGEGGRGRVGGGGEVFLIVND